MSLPPLIIGRSTLIPVCIDAALRKVVASCAAGYQPCPAVVYGIDCIHFEVVADVDLPGEDKKERMVWTKVDEVKLVSLLTIQTCFNR